MKPVSLLLLGVTASWFVNLADGAEKPPPQTTTQTRGLTQAQDIAAQYDAMERNLQLEYTKLINDAKRNIEELNSRIKQLDDRIKQLKEDAKKAEVGRTMPREGQRSTGPATEREVKARIAAIEREIENAQKQIALAKDQIKTLSEQIARLERDRDKALEDLRKQKAKALAAARR